MRRTVLFISDGTAITAETFGHSLLTQFSGHAFRQVRLPFVDTVDKAREAVELIDRAAEKDGPRPLVFSTIVDGDVGAVLRESNAHVFDMFATFLPQLEEVLDTTGSHSVGKAHGIDDTHRYEDRMEATNYALAHDDGISKRLDNADVVLVGVSRSGKTPTCLYMALHFGLKAANYPLTEEDLEQPRLPDFLRQHKQKLYGLTINAERLAEIRQTRRPDSRYASLKQCRYEVDAAESLLRSEGVAVLSSTRASVEELASRILLELGLDRDHFLNHELSDLSRIGNFELLCYAPEMLTQLRNPNSLSRVIARRLPSLHSGVFHALSVLMPEDLARSDILVSRIDGAPELYMRVLERHNYTTFLQLTYLLGPEREQHPNAHIRVYHDARMAEATSFSPEQGIERLAGPDLPVRGLVERSWRMNRALLKWLEYLLAEGHSASTMHATEETPADLPDPEPMPAEVSDGSVRAE